MAKFHVHTPERYIIHGYGLPRLSIADLPRQPYTYNGDGSTLPDEKARLAPARTPPPVPTLCLHDAPPTLADAPFCAPPEWHREFAAEEKS